MGSGGGGFRESASGGGGGINEVILRLYQMISLDKPPPTQYPPSPLPHPVTRTTPGESYMMMDTSPPLSNSSGPTHLAQLIGSNSSGPTPPPLSTTDKGGVDYYNYWIFLFQNTRSLPTLAFRSLTREGEGVRVSIIIVPSYDRGPTRPVLFPKLTCECSFVNTESVN